MPDYVRKHPKGTKALGVVVGVLVSTKSGLQLCIHIPEGLRDGDMAWVYPDKDIARFAVNFVDAKNVLTISASTQQLFDAAEADLAGLKQILRERKEQP